VHPRESRRIATKGRAHGTTHDRDASSQYYRRNRYYDAGTGRFTQEDPIGLAGGINLYGYADGDPISNSDPFGLCDPYPQCIGEEWAALERAGLRALKHYVRSEEFTTSMVVAGMMMMDPSRVLGAMLIWRERLSEEQPECVRGLQGGRLTGIRTRRATSLHWQLGVIDLNG
jgi:RHS repeat-associated protein